MLVDEKLTTPWQKKKIKDEKRQNIIDILDRKLIKDVRWSCYWQSWGTVNRAKS